VHDSNVGFNCFLLIITIVSLIDETRFVAGAVQHKRNRAVMWAIADVSIRRQVLGELIRGLSS